MAEGFLNKLGDIVKSWKRRYFVFVPQTGEMHYYESELKVDFFPINYCN